MAEVSKIVIPTLGLMIEAAPELHWRKCRDCGREGVHVKSITPWVLCPKCGSQDTRLMRDETDAMRR